MALLTMLGSVQAQEEEPEYYDVTICGKQLTSDILGDIVGTINTWIQEEGTGSISGTITYDPSTKTLTLTDVTAQTTESACVDIMNGVYKLVVKGTNTLTTLDGALTVRGCDLTITGGGKLTLQSTETESNYYGFLFDPCLEEGFHTLTLTDVTVDVKNSDLGGLGHEKLVVINANLKVKGQIYYWDDITLTSAAVTKPAGAAVVYHDYSSKYFIGDPVTEEESEDIEITALGESLKNPELAFSATSYDYVTSDATHEWPTLTNPHGLSVTYTSSDESVATVDATTGVVTPQAGGTTIIAATFAGNDDYYPSAAKYILTVTVDGNPSDFHLSTRHALLAYDAPLDLSKLVVNPHGLPVKYEVNEEYQYIATVDAHGLLTALSAPFAIVTVSTPGNLEYAAASDCLFVLIGSEDEIKKLRCDANGDGSVTITDAVTVVNYILNEP